MDTGKKIRTINHAGTSFPCLLAIHMPGITTIPQSHRMGLRALLTRSFPRTSESISLTPSIAILQYNLAFEEDTSSLLLQLLMALRLLPLRCQPELGEAREEAGESLGSAPGIGDGDAGRTQSGNRERHCDAVVAVGLDSGTVRGCRLNAEAARPLLHGHADAAQFGGQGRARDLSPAAAYGRYRGWSPGQRQMELPPPGWARYR